MQPVEFNNLMLGKDAKWADMKEVPQLKEVCKSYTNEQKVGLRSLIEKHEQPIPEPTLKEIHDFIAKLRADGHKETKIRRIVKKQFRITVV